MYAYRFGDAVCITTADIEGGHLKKNGLGFVLAVAMFMVMDTRAVHYSMAN